jgi:hypothetical protein
MNPIDQALAAWWQHHETLRLVLALTVGALGVTLAAAQQWGIRRRG